MDPVEDLAALAAEHGVGCHVDACIGGFVLPFLERLGHDVPPWDFRVEGVTEISADVHKYGYCPKGASVILHRDADWFGHQVFLYDQWPSGLYGSPGIAGARPAAPIATAWAVHRRTSASTGYVEIMRDLMATTAKVRAGDRRRSTASRSSATRSGRCCRCDPTRSISTPSRDVMDDRGWNLNRNTEPRGLHLMLSPAHAAVVDELLADLTRRGRAPRRVARRRGPLQLAAES